MADAFLRAKLEQELLDNYPAYSAALDLFRSVRGLMGRISPLGRQLIARVLVAMAEALGQILLDAASTLVAPQLVQLQRLARACRDLAMLARRYASVSTGTLNVYLTGAARSVLGVFEQRDPARGVIITVDPTRDLLSLIHGVSVY